MRSASSAHPERSLTSSSLYNAPASNRSGTSSSNSNSKSPKPATNTTLLSVGDPDSDAANSNLQLAEEWHCSSYASLLGIAHLIAGCILLVFDVATNERTGLVFGVSSALAYILCATLAFIAARRVDRLAQRLLLGFASVAAVLSAALFVESAKGVNGWSTGEGGGSDLRMIALYSFLLCLALIELLVSSVTAILCFRSLRDPYVGDKERSGNRYSAFILGEYANLKHHQPSSPMTLQ